MSIVADLLDYFCLVIRYFQVDHNILFLQKFVNDLSDLLFNATGLWFLRFIFFIIFVLFLFTFLSNADLSC